MVEKLEPQINGCAMDLVEPRIPLHYLLVMQPPLEAAGFDLVAVLASVGIDEKILNQPDAMIASATYVTLLLEVRRLLKDEFLGMGAERSRPGCFALMVRYVSQQETLMSVLKEMSRFYRTCFGVEMGFDRQGEHNDIARLYFNFPRNGNDKHYFLSEFMFTVFHRTLCWLTGTRILLLSAEFNYPKPAHHRFYQNFSACENHFDREFVSFSFPASCLSLPVVVTKTAMKHFLERAPIDLLVVPGDNMSIATRVKGFVLQYQRDGHGVPDFAVLAREFCVSPQTLRRKLRAEQTGYQAIKDELRSEIAMDKLVNEDISIAEIAESLGFLEPASFTRAFRQWTGVSPMDFRRENRRVGTRRQ